MSETLLIERDNRSTTNGKPDPPRVYVTGPHFGADIYSSTTKVADASRFTPDQVNRMRGFRHWQNVRLVPLAEAKDLAS